MTQHVQHIAMPAFINTRREVALLGNGVFNAPYAFTTATPQHIRILDKDTQYMAAVGDKAFAHSMICNTILLFSSDENGQVTDCFELRRIDNGE